MRSADALSVKTGDQGRDPGPRLKQVLERKRLRTAVVYRTQAKGLKAQCEQANYGEPDEVQFEMCEFTDGRVAQRLARRRAKLRVVGTR